MKTLMKVCLWVLAFAPLIVVDAVFFPYISGKNLLIRLGIAFVSLLFAGYLAYSKQFRKEIGERARNIVKNPVFISISISILVFIISAFFALNGFRAFFGDVERGEGLLGMLFFYGFFIYSLLIFERKDWSWFFRLTLITTFILVAKQIFEFLGGANRPGSFTGNPTFLAGFLLFGLASAWIVFSEKNKNWKYFAVLVALMSIAGIFIAETRGTILGLIGGIGAIIVYGGVKGKEIQIFQKFNLRKISLALLGILILASFGFYATRSNPIWQKVPGLNRLAQIGIGDNTTDTRLIALGVSLKSINPENSGLERLLVGWGPENYSIAYNKNYNTLHYKLEHEWFDRSHNKLMDVLVMNGVLGLAIYLLMWGAFVWIIFRNKGFSNELMAMLFFGAAYFMHILVVFDQISTYIPFFGVLAFTVFIILKNKEDLAGKKTLENKKQKFAASEMSKREQAGLIGASIVGLFFLWGLIAWTLVPFVQMGNYISAITSSDNVNIRKDINDAMTPYTYAQENIRGHYLGVVTSNYGKNSQVQTIFEDAILGMEDLVAREPYNARNLLILGRAYDMKGKVTKDGVNFKKAEEIYRKALALAPRRPDVNYPLALNFLYQGRNDEAIELLRTVLSWDDQVPETHFYLGEALAYSGQEYYEEALANLEFGLSKMQGSSPDSSVSKIYQSLIGYFYTQRDAENFIIAAKRMEILAPEYKDDLEKAIELARKGMWGNINFK